jgi:hypothetical protein
LRILADNRLRPVIAAACILCAVFGRAGAADPSAIDRNLPARQDTLLLRQVISSFHERFKYDAATDSVRYGTVEQFKTLYPESYWTGQLGQLTNENGTLAWSASQDMLALVIMYDVTGDPWYLRMLGRYAEGAMAVRDDVLGKKDADGRSLPGWGSSRYDVNGRHVYLVHSGLIVLPILEYAVRAPKLPDWSAANEAKRQKLIDRCRETLLFHDYQLDPELTGDEAAYIAGREEAERYQTYQPFNRQNTFARCFYLLNGLTGDAGYLERSRRLYRFFQRNIERTPADAYIWEYEPPRAGGPVRVAVCDDISHGSYALQPVIPACEDEFIFTRADLARFARTFTKYIYLGDGVFQARIGCEVTDMTRIMDRLYAWLPLAQADPRVYWLIHRFLLKNYEKPAPLAIAYLIQYRPKGLTGVDTRAH